jgi:transposase InsO family protein
VETRLSGAEGGPGKRAGSNPGTAPRPDPYTKLAGPRRGVYYHLYVMIDIFSRCAVHSEVHATELGELAKDFITEAVRLNGGITPHAIHADRGTSMTSKTVSALLSDLAILKSHSRPKVSNDNPYSEAQLPGSAGRDLTCPPPQIRT